MQASDLQRVRDSQHQIKQKIISSFIEDRNNPNFDQQIINLVYFESLDMDLLGLNNIQEYVPENPSHQKTNDYLSYLTQGAIQLQSVFEFAKVIKTQIHTDLISNFNMKEINLVDQIINEILQRITFKDLYSSNRHQQKSLEKLAMQAFINKCNSQNQLVLPLLLKIREKRLILVDYAMNAGLCQGLKQAFVENNKCIEKLLIDNCALTDAKTETILIGANELEKFRSLTLKNSEIGPRSYA